MRKFCIKITQNLAYWVAMCVYKNLYSKHNKYKLKISGKVELNLTGKK